ncbi:hypothetical protein D3C81_1617990 [compost metagenome]
MRRLDADHALKHIPADHGHDQQAERRQNLGRGAAHLLQGSAGRGLKRNGGFGELALETLNGGQLVQTQGAGVGPDIAHGEDARRQDRKLVLLQRRQVARMHPRHGRQLGHGAARGETGRAQGLAQRLGVLEGRRVLPILIHAGFRWCGRRRTLPFA